jgi:GT2 family glycosyltransferase
LYPDEILIIDGSTNDDTKSMLDENKIENLIYFKVDELNRGLTRQRNFGLKHVHESIDIICFLDDDVVLTKSYFKELISTYLNCSEALAVGGYILNEAEWKKCTGGQIQKGTFIYDGWHRNEPIRYRIRKLLGLLPDTKPGYLPTFSHGRSIGFFPPSGKIYQVEQIMGGVSSYKKIVFDKIRFSNYFEGYGLYEDADFSLRLARLGKLYINTNAKLYHYHDESGRPNKFKYGKMVIRNGWYIWRVKYPNPNIKAKFKWNATAMLLTIIRLLNVINTDQKKEAFAESLGRIAGWVSLIFNKPKLRK